MTATATNYSIKSLRGTHIRDQHRTATAETVERVLADAARYLGCESPGVRQMDDGRWVAYESEAHADADVGQGGSADPILVARAAEG